MGFFCAAPDHDVGPTSPDDYKIGDRVWVAGAKPGIIAYIGDTQFAPGEWAGVVLDQPVGKNDGSVAGVRYFQCEAKRGVFSRVNKLTSKPVQKDTPASSPLTPSLPASMAMGPPASTPAKTVKAPGAPNGAAPSRKTATGSARPSGLVKMSVSGSQSNLAAKTSPLGSMSNLSMSGGEPKHHHIKVGDRVLVSGTKAGVLRYIGPTEFAKGDWAGVALNEPLGKNDGSVAGRRYVVHF